MHPEDREAAANKHHMMSALAKALAPRPIIELAGRIWLSDRDRARLFDQHDAGDEDAKARSYGRIVCGRKSKAGDRCERGPSHFGFCDWEIPRWMHDPGDEHVEARVQG